MTSTVQLIQLSLSDLQELILDAVHEAMQQRPTPKLEHDLVTLKEAQRFLGISRNTLYAWQRKGLINDHRVQRKCYFTRAEIAALNRSTI